LEGSLETRIITLRKLFESLRTLKSWTASVYIAVAMRFY
jgi:hypothetical protein